MLRVGSRPCPASDRRVRLDGWVFRARWLRTRQRIQTEWQIHRSRQRVDQVTRVGVRQGYRYLLLDAPAYQRAQHRWNQFRFLAQQAVHRIGAHSVCERFAPPGVCAAGGCDLQRQAGEHLGFVGEEDRLGVTVDMAVAGSAGLGTEGLQPASERVLPPRVDTDGRGVRADPAGHRVAQSAHQQHRRGRRAGKAQIGAAQLPGDGQA